MSSVSVEHAAWVEGFVLRHQQAVRRFLVYLGCPGDLLDDLVQDVFLSVLGTGFADRDPRSTRAFLRKAARHLYLKTLQRMRRETQLDEGQLAAAEAEWVGFQGDDEGERYLTALRECLAGLRQRAREVLRLRYQGGRSREAIALELGMSESGVKSILVRSKKRLRTCVEGRLAG